MTLTPPNAPTGLIEKFGGEGKWADLNGNTFYVEYDGPANKVPMVLVHGLGGSHLNWALVAKELSADRKVYVLDLPGFGLTNPEGRRTDVDSNAAIVSMFIEQVIGTQAIVVGNSMGGFITTLVAENSSDLVAAVVLVDPALPLPVKRPDRVVFLRFLGYLTPKVGERVMRRNRARCTPYQQVEETQALCFADLTRVNPELTETSADLAAYRRSLKHSDASFLAAVRSVMRRNSKKTEVKARLAAMPMPVLLLHGDRDRLVAVEAARIAATENPHWTYVEYSDIGHTPMLECPTETVASINEFLAAAKVDPKSRSVDKPSRQRQRK